MTASWKAACGLAALGAWLGMAGPGGAAPHAGKKPRPAAPAAAKPAAAASPAPAASNVPLLPGAGSKEPVNIDAGKLDYFDKEQKLVYAGDVVAVQGDSTLKASVLTIYLQKQDAANSGGATAPASSPSGGFGAPGQGSSVRHMEAQGPVTLISKDQIGTGNSATYDKAENRVYLNGNVTLSQGANVTQGDRLVYDLTTGQAQVFAGITNPRVKSVFTPGSAAPGESPEEAKPAENNEQPVAAKHKAATARKNAPENRTAASTAATGRLAPAPLPDAAAEQ